MWRLCVPLRYLLIRHPEKIKFDLYFPVVVALCLSFPLLSDKFLIDAKANLTVLVRSSDLLSVLTGFFVAALAAISTFGNSEMDAPMAGVEPVTLKNEELSRRRFLSYLFGYLAFSAIFLYILGFVFYAAQKYMVEVLAPSWSTASLVVFWIIYAFLLGNLLSNALLGLFYLTDRIHRPNRVISFKDKTAPKKDDDSKAA